MKDNSEENRKEESEEIVLENIYGGKQETLTRIDNPDERRALQELGYVVIKDLYTGKYFVKGWGGR